jgi:ubiquinone/menaquinone biosynthesis C-methylase UbiE
MTDLVEYYGARAPEYELIYAKPERQADLAQLHEIVPGYFASRHLLEVACGTGYWTRRIAERAASIVATDLSPEVLALARQRQPAGSEVTFVRADAFALERVAGDFDAALAGFWLSHVSRPDIPRFLGGLHRRLVPGSVVMLIDNTYVAESSSPVSRTDTAGNNYQRRQLLDGREYEVLKNFFTPNDLRSLIAASGGEGIAVHELTYYWYATYRT